MADVSKITGSNGTPYDIISKQTRSIIFCRLASTSTASAFKVSVGNISSLYNGLTLYIYNNVVTSEANATLELNNFGAKRIKINGGADDVGNYWRYDRAYLFVFDSANNRWVMNYTDIDTVLLTQAQYDALVAAGTVDPNISYYITDRNNSGATYASGIHYDNTSSGLDATNVQSAIDEVADKLDITDITSTYCTTATGVTIEANDSSVYKQGKHIWGNLQFVIPSTTSQQVIATITSGFQPSKTIISYAGYSGSKWSVDTIGSLYVGTNKNIACSVSVSGKTYVNISIDYLTP